MVERLLGGLCAILLVGCGEAGFVAAEEEEPIATSAEALVVPKGQVAFAQKTDTSETTLFMSWGWLYWNSLLHTQGYFELLAKTSTYPKSLTATFVFNDLWVFWIEGNQVKAKRRHQNVWEATFNFSPTSVLGGTLTRVVATQQPTTPGSVPKGPGLVGLTSNGKLLTNWYVDEAWAGWCESAWFDIPDGADVAAYKHNNGIMAFAVNTLDSGVPHMDYGFIHRECDVRNPLHLPTSFADGIQRFSADGISNGLPLLPQVFRLNSAGEIVSNAQGSQPFVPPIGPDGNPAQFRAFTNRARPVTGGVGHKFYAVDTSGNFWASYETTRPNENTPVNNDPGWLLMP